MTDDRFLTPQERADYGDEFLDVVGKKAREVTGGELQQLQAQVQGLKSHLTLQSRRAMMDQLTHGVPDWSLINHDPAFHKWLSVRNEYSGRVRHDELRAAWASNDTQRVLSFFRGFIAERRHPSPAPAALQRGYPAGNSSQSTWPTMTRKDIELHYQNRMRGRVSDEQHREFEARMEAAAKAGRIPGGLDVGGK